MTVSETAGPGFVGTSSKRRPSASRYGVVFLSAIILCLLALGIANYELDPLTFSAAAQRDVARHFEQGENFANYDPNIDFRGLRREHINLMSGKPDVILFAGSRFEVATKNLFPGHSFYNAFVHNDYFEDLLAVTELLRSANRLPKNLVMSVRFATFLPLEARETEEWKMFWPEYRAMADRLGIEKVSFARSFPWNNWGRLFSLDGLIHRTRLELDSPSSPGPVSAAFLPDLDVLRADGSLGFSKKHQGSFTPESSREDAVKKAAQAAAKSNWPMDAARVAALGPLFDYLKGQGVHVAIAITPHHPAYWAGVVNAPYGRTLQTIETEVTKIASEHGAILVGSFDPAKAGCVEASFRDYIHMDEACLKAVFQRIPLAL